MVSVILGVVGALTGTLGLAGVIYLYLKAQDAPERVLRAFKALEQDFEDLSDRVASSLGRISRLKRETIQRGEGNPAPDTAGAAQTTLQLRPAPVPRLTRSRLLALAHRRGGANGPEQNSSGDDGR